MGCLFACCHFMEKSDCYFLGTVTKLHGYSGELNIFLDVDYPEKYKKIKSVLIEVNKDLVPFFVQSISFKNNMAIVKLEDVDTPEQASALVNHDLYLPLSSLPPLTGKRFYFHEVIGFQVVDENEGELGVIARILDLPRQAVIEMIYKEKEVLIPISEETVVNVDRTAKQFFVKLPEGLLEIYL